MYFTATLAMLTECLSPTCLSVFNNSWKRAQFPHLSMNFLYFPNDLQSSFLLVSCSKKARLSRYQVFRSFFDTGSGAPRYLSDRRPNIGLLVSSIND